MIFNFWKQVEFLQATKTIIFRNTNISNMHSLSQFDHQVAPLRKLFLRKLFDVKERLQVICCLDFTEGGCVFACLESLKKLS